MLRKYLKCVQVVIHDHQPELDDAQTESSDEPVEITGTPKDEHLSSDHSPILNLNSWNLWALAMSTVIGGQFYDWNRGLSAGFCSLLIATVLVSSAYICLVLSIAELSSALPFAGANAVMVYLLLYFNVFNRR